MSSKAERRARRAGRPRKADAPRYPSGQTKHRPIKERENEILSVAISARLRHGLAETFEAARDARLGYPLGLAWRNGLITETQHEAGRILAERYARQLRAIDAPAPTARIAQLDAIRGAPKELPPFLVQEWRGQWREVFEALKAAGAQPAQETARVSIFDHAPQSIDFLQAGLKNIIKALKL